MILGCQYLHRNRVIHRDLKLGNLFLNEDLEVKIGEVLGLQGTKRRLGAGREEEGGKAGLLITPVHHLYSAVYSPPRVQSPSYI